MFTHTKDQLIAAATSIIGKINFAEDRINRFISFSNLDSKFIKFCVSEEIISEAVLKELIHTRLMSFGRECLENDCSKTWADHVRSPHALAYAIAHGEIKSKEYSKIRFDNNDTAETFYRSRIECLIDKLVVDAQTQKQNNVYDFERDTDLQARPSLILTNPNFSS